MNKKMFVTAAIAALMSVGAYFGNTTTTPSEGLSDLLLENAEALANGEITVVGCIPMRDATCYVFDGNGQLVDRRKNQYPGN